MSLIDMTQDEFGSRVEQYRYELQVHCYRMLGTTQDAEDMVQETFLRAWKRRETYTEESLLRAWLYKIATNACLDTLKMRRRRVIPMTLGAATSAAEAIPPAILEPIWLEPYPDELLAWAGEHPEQRLMTRESISIAFLAALQLLPPRQRAVLILSDVLDWSAGEVAALLDTTVSAVKSALHRARASIAAYHDRSRISDASAYPQPAVLQPQLDQYVRAWEMADVETLVSLLCEDATFSMPPIPSWYRGRSEIRALVSNTIFSGAAAGRWCLLPTRANGQTAFGLYRQSESGGYQAYGIQVLTIDQSLIADIVTFRNPALVSYFQLPSSL